LDLKKDKFIWITLILFSSLFFYKTIIFGLLPIPADALVGLYHPFRDYFAADFPNGIPFKNYILTDPVLQQYPWKWLAINGWKEIFSGVFKGQALPWQGLALSHILENPYNFSGMPLLANIQAGVFYPLNIIFILISNFPLAWTAFIIIQPIMAALFMYWWLKENTIKQSAAIFGGLVWAFSSFNLVWLEWGNIGHTGLWLPLALLAVDRLQKTMSRRSSRGLSPEGKQKTMKCHVLLQFSLVSSLLAGHWQITLYLLSAFTLYWLIRLGINRHSVSLLIVHCSLFIAFTSPQLLPTIKFTLQSNRSVEQADVLSREGFFIRPRQLVQLISPDFFGNPSTLNYRGSWNYAEQIIYIGIIPLLFALLGIFIKDSQGNNVVSINYNMFNLHKFCLLLMIVGLLFAVKNPIAEIPFRLNVPVWQDLQPTRLSYLITFGLATLSALGFNEFIKHPRKLLSKVMTILAILAILLFTFLVVSSKFSPEDKLISQRNLIFSSFTLIAVILISGVLRFVPKRIYSLLFALLFLLSVFDLFRFGWKFTPFSPKEYLYPITPVIKFLQENMQENDRYMTLDRRILPPNANIIYKLKSIEGYDPIYSKSYARFITEMETGRNEEEPASFGRIVRPTNYKSPVTALLGVRYVLSLSGIEEKEWTKVFQEGDTRIYEKQ